MQSFTQTFTAVGTWRLNVSGRYFTVISSANAVGITFYRGGKKLELGQVSSILAGIEFLFDVGEGFDAVDIAVTADTITVGIGNGQARYNRMSGSVDINTGKVPRVTAPTSVQATVTNASAVLVAANATRQFLAIQNNDLSGSIAINISGAAATFLNSIIIKPGEYWEPNSSVPTTAIQAIGDIASNPNIVVVQG